MGGGRDPQSESQDLQGFLAGLFFVLVALACITLWVQLKIQRASFEPPTNPLASAAGLVEKDREARNEALRRRTRVTLAPTPITAAPASSPTAPLVKKPSSAHESRGIAPIQEGPFYLTTSLESLGELTLEVRARIVKRMNLLGHHPSALKRSATVVHDACIVMHGLHGGEPRQHAMCTAAMVHGMPCASYCCSFLSTPCRHSGPTSSPWSLVTFQVRGGGLHTCACSMLAPLALLAACMCPPRVACMPCIGSPGLDSRLLSVLVVLQACVKS
jgi:hypothetical protein